MGTNVFKLNSNSQYEIIDYIKGDDEVNNDTSNAIRAKYSTEEELKLHRLNAITPNNVDFIAYNTFVEQCRSDGMAKKLANASDLALLKEVDLPQESGMPVKIMVRE